MTQMRPPPRHPQCCYWNEIFWKLIIFQEENWSYYWKLGCWQRRWRWVWIFYHLSLAASVSSAELKVTTLKCWFKRLICLNPVLMLMMTIMVMMMMMMMMTTNSTNARNSLWLANLMPLLSTEAVVGSVSLPLLRK